MKKNTSKQKTKKKNPITIKRAAVFYFTCFALFLLIFVYVLQSVFIDTLYSRMKSDEIKETVNDLVTLYDEDSLQFAIQARQIANQNSLYIKLETENDSFIFQGISENNTSSYTYIQLTEYAKEELSESSLNLITLSITDPDSEITYFIYAIYLNPSSTEILYAISPISPAESTISIFKVQLLYICLISLLLAFILAIIISNRLIRPIQSISRSAVELSKGNYNTVFNGDDFAETEELANALNTASYEMQRTEYYQRDLIANVSHDLKTPLTMIKSYAEMIDDISGDDPEKRHEHLQVIISETDRLNKLVNDLLTASKLQSNSVPLEKETFDFVEAAHEVFESFEVLNEQEDYRITFKSCKSALVYADRDKIKQVMTNLVSNAVKYCGEDKVVQIELKHTSKKIRFDVIDHGEGISQDEISHVWDRYYRTSSNHVRNIEGSGIGLSITKSILSLHNAKYGVESTLGEGSDFWFEMDIVKK